LSLRRPIGLHSTTDSRDQPTPTTPALIHSGELGFIDTYVKAKLPIRHHLWCACECQRADWGNGDPGWFPLQRRGRANWVARGMRPGVCPTWADLGCPNAERRTLKPDGFLGDG
jgi:hypothetical protein